MSSSSVARLANMRSPLNSYSCNGRYERALISSPIMALDDPFLDVVLDVWAER